MTSRTSTIFVTGCPRSGTTWLGKILAAPPDVRYVGEPCNVKWPCPGSTFRSKFSFEQVSPDDTLRLKELADLFTRRGRIWTLKKPRVSLKRLVQWYACELVSRKKNRTIVKDPAGLLSTETFSQAFNTDVVVINRRPESVVASHLGRGWDFRNLAEYVESMRPLNIWTDAQLDPVLECEDSPVDRLAHMWRLLAIWGMQLRDRHPDWSFICYEDAARNPDKVFPRLCKQLGLRYEGARQDFLESMNKASKSRAGRENVMDVKRSRDQLSDPDTVLEPDQDRRVKEICRHELGILYPETLESLQSQ